LAAGRGKPGDGRLAATVARLALQPDPGEGHKYSIVCYYRRGLKSASKLKEWDPPTSGLTFRWKDYAHDGKQGQMTLAATEFLRRFFLHVLPKGFVRIRHFGFLANRFRASRLALGRHLLASCDSTEQEVKTHDVRPESSSLWHCPRCGASMIVIQRITAAELSACIYFDSS